MAEDDNLMHTAMYRDDGSPADMQWLMKPSRELRYRVLVGYLSEEPPFCSVGKQSPSEKSEKETGSQVPLFPPHNRNSNSLSFPHCTKLPHSMLSSKDFHHLCSEKQTEVLSMV